MKCEVHVPTPPPPSPPPTEREYRQLDQRCRAVNTSSLKRTSNSFMKLTTLATMSATVEAKTSSIINRATLRLLAPGQSVLDFLRLPEPSLKHSPLWSHWGRSSQKPHLLSRYWPSWSSNSSIHFTTNNQCYFIFNRLVSPNKGKYFQTLLYFAIFNKVTEYPSSFFYLCQQ